MERMKRNGICTRIFTFAVGVTLTVALVATPEVADAQAALCELDWNCDGAISFEDVYDDQPGGLDGVAARGFYSDVHYYITYAEMYHDYVAGGYYHKQQCGGAGVLDWNGDGAIGFDDAYAGNPSPGNLGPFYTQWYVYMVYPTAYAYFYPESDCVESCDLGFELVSGACQDIDECAMGTDDCTAGYYCVNTVGSYNCNDINISQFCDQIGCDPGYDCVNTPEPDKCVDIDECALGTDNCSAGFNCENTEGSFTCVSIPT